MAAFDAATPLEGPLPQPRPRARPAPRPAPQRAASGRDAALPRLAGSVVWIALLALLLTGVVALNVAVLRLNMRLDELARARADLRADNAALQARISSESTLVRVESLARSRLGLQPAEPAETGYVRLDR